MSHKNYDPLEHEPLPEGREAPPPLTHTMSIVRWTILIGMSLFALIMILSSLGLAPWEARADDAIQYHCPMHPTYISNQPGECPICGMSLVAIDSESKKAAETDSSGNAKEAKSQMKAETVAYQCPMHPEVTSDKPGECSKCGMDLAKVASSKDTIQSITYSCPMHPEVVSDKPGECPKCGMDLVLASSSARSDTLRDEKAAKKPAADAKYFCPMHPEITSDKPGRCPICKMYLEPVSDTTKTAPKGKTDGKSSNDMQSMTGMDETSDLGKAPVPGLVPVTIEPERLQLIGVRTAPVQKRNLGDKIDVVGFVTPDETHMSNINSRVSGWVVNLFVDKTGQYVKAGEPLLSLYSQDLYQAEQDFMAARDALKNGSIDNALASMRRQIYAAARQRLLLLGLTDDQVNELEQTDLPSAQMTIVSPFSGYVLEKTVLPGQYLSPNQSLFTIADLSNVWVLGDVYEQDIPYVHSGQKAHLKLTAYPGESFEGKVAYVYPSISEKTRTLKVRLQFPNPSMRIKPGMYADIELARSQDQVLAVPSGAVLDGGDLQYAFVVHDGKHFEPRMVKVGRSSDDWTEILSGLDPGEEVVTSANFLIDSESRLKAAVAGMAGTVKESKEPTPPGHVH